MINSSSKTQTIGTDSTVISEAKLNSVSERIRLIITNTSVAAQVISISTGNEAKLGEGITISPGGSISWEKQTNTPIMQLRVAAISSAAGGTLSIYEEVNNRW
jgi:hypothetical protein